MTTFLWLGDEDPSAQVVTIYGHTFVKGAPVNVTDKMATDKLAANSMFSKEKSAKVAEAEEPTADELAARAEEGTEKAALKAELREMGVTLAGNPSVDTLREKLAAAHRAASN